MAKLRRVIENYPDYDVSSCGEVRRVKPPKKGPGVNRTVPYAMTHFLRSGYPTVRLCNEQGAKSVSVHRLVCAAFNGAPKSNELVAHNDGNPLNCHAENLRWTTQKDNHADKLRHGTHRSGEAIGNSKLSERQVKQIRQRRAAGEIYRTIAEDFQITIANAHAICARKVWPHVD